MYCTDVMMSSHNDINKGKVCEEMKMAPLSRRTVTFTVDFLLLLCVFVWSVQEAAHSAAPGQRGPHAAHLLQLPGGALPLPVLRLQQVTGPTASPQVLDSVSLALTSALCVAGMHPSPCTRCPWWPPGSATWGPPCCGPSSSTGSR